MKVKELVEALKGVDPDSDVLIASSKNWPVEVSVAGLVSREEVLESGEELPEGVKNGDVFLVEGKIIRYGKRAIWKVLAGDL